MKDNHIKKLWTLEEGKTPIYLLTVPHRVQGKYNEVSSKTVEILLKNFIPVDWFLLLGQTSQIYVKSSQLYW